MLEFHWKIWQKKKYPLDEPLPWDFIDIGVEKEWLINEYNEAMKNNTKPSCQTVV